MNPNAIWYLAHPVAGDDRFTYEQNLDHALKMAKICYEEGFRVFVPWHTLCLIMPDADEENRRIGLEVDCELVRMTGRLILVGHKISRGMRLEMDAFHSSQVFRGNEVGTGEPRLLDLTSLSDSAVRHGLQVARR